MFLRSSNPDPFALGKYKHYSDEFRLVGWLLLLFFGFLFLDSQFAQKLNNETVVTLQDKVEYVRTGGKYGGSRPRSYFELTTENLELRLSPYEVGTLNIKSGDKISYWRTYFFRQRLLLGANEYSFRYIPYPNGKYKKVFYLQGAMALIGLLGFIPGQVRQMGIIISALLCIFSLLHL